MKRQRTNELVVDGLKKNESINILHTKYVERRHLSIIFDDPSLRPEKILYPTEPVAIYPRPPDARIFLFAALPTPDRPQRERCPYPVPRPPRANADNFLAAHPSPRGPEGPRGSNPLDRTSLLEMTT
jgi:hypothetical protein